jgi:hypothetical protein
MFVLTGTCNTLLKQQVALGTPARGLNCGAALLSRFAIVTAAHCVYGW